MDDRDLAQEAIEDFEDQFDLPHLYLAYHAAFPLVLTPDLLYHIWANFQRDMQGELLHIPWVAVADLLLSPLCRELRHETYQMDRAARDLLLEALQADPRFQNDDHNRLYELAGFVHQYVAKDINSPHRATKEAAEAQQWAAYAYAVPEHLVMSLANKYYALQEQDQAQYRRLATLLQTFDTSFTTWAKPPQEIETEFQTLFNYGQGMAKFVRGREMQAAKQLTPLISDEGQIQLAGFNLPVPEIVVKRVNPEAQPVREDQSGVYQSHPEFATVTDKRQGLIWIDRGIVHGLTEGSQLLVYPPETDSLDDLGQPLATLTMVEVEIARGGCLAEEAGQALDIPLFARAVISHRSALQRQVILELIDAALLDAVQTHLLTEASLTPYLTVAGVNPSEADFFIYNLDETLEIRDTEGRLLVTPFAQDDLKGLGQALLHLTHYLNRLSLSNTVDPDLAEEVEIDLKKLVFDPVDHTPQAEAFPRSDRGELIIKADQKIVVEVTNHAAVPLYVTLLEFGYQWSIAQLYPNNGDAIEALKPGRTLSLGLSQKQSEQISFTLPEPMTEIRDTIKVIATTEAIDLVSLTLGPLDVPTTPPTETKADISPDLDAPPIPAAKAKGGVSSIALGELIISKIVVGFDLEEEDQAYVNGELTWLFNAVDHFLKISRNEIDRDQPVVVEIPPDAERAAEADNRLLTNLDNEALPHWKEEAESLLEETNTLLKTLDVLLHRKTRMFEAKNLDLQNRIRSGQIQISQTAVDLARLMQQVYGIYVTSPEQLAEFLKE